MSFSAWTKEAIDRLVQIAQYFGGKAGEAAAKVAADQLAPISKKIAALQGRTRSGNLQYKL